jgi:hypothetical protein
MYLQLQLRTKNDFINYLIKNNLKHYIINSGPKLIIYNSTNSIGVLSA